MQLDTRGSELLFQILTEREEKSSIALASNLPFSEWGQVIPDARLVAAIVDRVTFNAHIIETGTESYRLRTTRQRQAGGAKSNEQVGPIRLDIPISKGSSTQSCIPATRISPDSKKMRSA